MITDPRFAPKRTDLPWLRHRRLPRASAPVEHEGAPQLGDFLVGHASHHQHDAPPPTPAPTTPAPTTPAPTTPAPTPPAPTPPAPPRPAVSSSLDLDEPAPQSRPAPPAPEAAPARRRRTDVRVKAGDRLVLSPGEPTVTLTRLQSGIGTLTFEAAASEEVGDLRLGCAYELDDGLELTMQMTQGNRFAPPHAKRPVLVGGRDRFERIQLDLRRCRELRRLVVYAFSEGRRPLKWGGTLIVTTFGGARVEQPLDVLQGGQIAVLMSAYQVRGELVLRAEMETLFGDVREAARAYGYDKISWLDDRTPVE